MARLTNDEAFAVVYSDILLYRDNNLANFNLDAFDDPTGQLVPGGPSSLTLAPGETVDLSFGAVAVGTYQYPTASAAPTADPGVTFRVAVAAVPEPPAVALFGAGSAALLLDRRRRRHASGVAG